MWENYYLGFDGNGRPIASSTIFKWHMTFNDQGKVSFCCYPDGRNPRWLAAFPNERDLDTNAVRTQPHRQAWEEWYADPYYACSPTETMTVALKSEHGTWLCGTDKWQLILQPHRQAWERWQIVRC